MKMFSRLPKHHLLGIVMMAAATVTLAGYGLYLKNEKQKFRGSKSSSVNVSYPIAALKVRRLNALGDTRDYILDCPGAPMCSATVQTNGKPTLQTSVKWDQVEEFFAATSTSQFVLQRRKPASDSTALVEWTLRMNQFSSSGIITERDISASPVLLWEAMILSRF